LFAIVDGDKIPPRCFGELLCVAATDRRCAKAYEALCDVLCRNRQVGITTVALDGAPTVAALVPIGHTLAVSPLRPEYTRALADGLRALLRRGRSRRVRRIQRMTLERRAAA